MRRRTKKNVRGRDEEDISAPPQEEPPAETVREAPTLVCKPTVYRPKRRRFHRALLVSLIFHLSMVTLFRIVIHVPRNDMEYYQFHIEQAHPPTVLAAASSEIPTAGPPLDGQLRLGDGMGSRLPEIELPTIEFAELARLQARQRSLHATSRYDELFKSEKARDLWAQFGQGVHRVRASLSSLRPGDQPNEMERPATPERPEPIRFRPAEGYAGILQWQTPPYDRGILFSPPIDALWEQDASALRKPIEFVVEVAPNGRAVNVWSPAIDESGLTDRVQIALLGYRFAPLNTDAPQRQMGTLRILAKGDADD